MTQEEKAKAYDEALKYGRYLIDTRCKEGSDGSFHRSDLEKMFPELAESEDERIRKAIIGYIDHDQHYGVSKKDMLAWLEKQEQKSDWSEEDEKMFNDAIGALWADDYYIYEDKQEIENWLKSIKQRIEG